MTHRFTDPLHDDQLWIPGWLIMALAIIAIALVARLAYLGIVGAIPAITAGAERNPAHDLPENRVEWQDVDPDRSRPVLDLDSDL